MVLSALRQKEHGFEAVATAPAVDVDCSSGCTDFGLAGGRHVPAAIHRRVDLLCDDSFALFSISGARTTGCLPATQARGSSGPQPSVLVRSFVRVDASHRHVL